MAPCNLGYTYLYNQEEFLDLMECKSNGYFNLPSDDYMEQDTAMMLLSTPPSSHNRRNRDHYSTFFVQMHLYSLSIFAKKTSLTAGCPAHWQYTTNRMHRQYPIWPDKAYDETCRCVGKCIVAPLPRVYNIGERKGKRRGHAGIQNVAGHLRR